MDKPAWAVGADIPLLTGDCSSGLQAQGSAGDLSVSLTYTPARRRAINERHAKIAAAKAA